jgi:hypothetical protein
MTLAGVDGFTGVSASPSLSLMIAAGCVLAGATRAAGRAPGPSLSSSWRGVAFPSDKIRWRLRSVSCSLTAGRGRRTIVVGNQSQRGV